MNRVDELVLIVTTAYALPSDERGRILLHCVLAAGRCEGMVPLDQATAQKIRILLESALTKKINPLE